MSTQPSLSPSVEFCTTPFHSFHVNSSPHPQFSSPYPTPLPPRKRVSFYSQLSLPSGPKHTHCSHPSSERAAALGFSPLHARDGSSVPAGREEQMLPSASYVLGIHMAYDSSTSSEILLSHSHNILVCSNRLFMRVAEKGRREG